jgi:hypothetical protein
MPAAAGWVDRAPDSGAPKLAAVEPPAAPLAVSKQAQTPCGVSAAGSALVVLGLTTMERTAWLGFNMLTTPIRLARRLLVSD